MSQGQDRKAAEALARAQALVDAGAGKEIEALAALKDVVQDYRGTVGAVLAARHYSHVEDQWLGREFKEITESEMGGNYRDALQRCDSLLEHLSDPVLKELVRDRRDYTERLARRAYKSIEQEATRRVHEGDPETAISLYQQAVDRIGLSDLVGAARAKALELGREANLGSQDDHRLPEQSPPEPEPDEDELLQRLRPPLK